MRARIAALAIVLSLLTVTAGAEEAHASPPDGGGPFGLGLILGSPLGLSGNYYIGNIHSLDFAVGFDAFDEDGFHIHGDYLWHPWVLAQPKGVDIELFLGVGGRLLFHDRGRMRDDHLHLGVRGPVGVSFNLQVVPVEIFAELALVLDFIFDDEDGDGESAIDLDIEGGIGARYYF